MTKASYLGLTGFHTFIIYLYERKDRLMNKKMFLILFPVVFALLINKNIVFAGFDSIYMVGDSTSITQKTTFGLDETPYLYMNLPGDGSLYTVWSWWHDPAGNTYWDGTAPIFDSTNYQVWLPLTHWFQWENVKTAGIWTIDANYYFSNNQSGTGVTSFTVTPEPISSILFLLGGSALAFRQHKKRKKNSN